MNRLNMRYILLLVLLLGYNTSIAQKKVKANDFESLVSKIIKNEYGRKWARSINEWRRSCYSINEANKCDTICVYIELIPWEACYCEIIQIGDSLYGFTNNYQSGVLCCEIDKGLRTLCDIMRSRDTSKMRKYFRSKEDGEKILDLSPIKIITINRQDNGFTYNSELVYFVDTE